jgi:hypothetical protein
VPFAQAVDNSINEKQAKGEQTRAKETGHQHESQHLGCIGKKLPGITSSAAK